MTFEYRDPTGELIYFGPAVVNWHNPTQAVAVETEGGRPLYFAVDHVEEVIVTVWDAARQAAGQTPTGPACTCRFDPAAEKNHRPWCAIWPLGPAAGQTVCIHPDGYEGECPCVTDCGCCKATPAAERHCACNHLRGQHNTACAHCPCVGFAETWPPQAAGQTPTTEPDPATSDDPTPLRWGLGDVLWSDDDTVIVCLSGPDREPYWLELDPERATALRDDLAGPDREEPAEAQPAEAPLTDAERQFLTFALDLAADRMASDDGFTDEDEAALARFRRMADEETH
ncbi:hypothetical protein [Streptomyces purpureus]|uniref:Uncharacterized protein n=1 Tax=Streptomyces purpureus TaxID=1951 RepID=A0A918LRN0_9ACTN|nr:hypothetical protein [Streptomyces purpureus]GGT43506.1 hypothetical protein GCM10014713_41530 [Streptomyces purpureus]